MIRRLTWVSLVALNACAAPKTDSFDNDGFSTGGKGGFSSDVGGASTAGKAGFGPVSEAVPFTDPVVVADPPPPPISGGTLLVSSTSRRVAVSDLLHKGGRVPPKPPREAEADILPA